MWHITARMIPERTVDTMFAIEVAQLIPYAIIWSPSNTRGQIDHVVSIPDTRAFIFECKGTITDAAKDPYKPWRSPIDRRQLCGYLGAGRPVLYVLPAKPARLALPWIRICNSDPDRQGRCRACHNSSERGSRRWAGESPTVKNAPFHVRFQPWFAHWCWVIPAQDLDRYLKGRQGDVDLPTEDHALARIPGADRLCHFLHAVHSGQPMFQDQSLKAEQLPEALAHLLSRRRTLDDMTAVEGEGEETTPVQVLWFPESSDVIDKR